MKKDLEQFLAYVVAVLITIYIGFATVGLVSGMLVGSFGDKSGCAKYESVGEKMNIGWVVGCNIFYPRF